MLSLEVQLTGRYGGAKFKSPKKEILFQEASLKEYPSNFLPKKQPLIV